MGKKTITFKSSGDIEKDQETIEMLHRIEERNARIYGIEACKIFKVEK